MILRKGKEGADEIKAMMTGYRNNPPERINNSTVIKINDYRTPILQNDMVKEQKDKNQPDKI